MWESLLVIGVQILTFFVKKSNISDKVKKNYFEWITLAGNDIGSVKLMEHGKKAMDWFDKNPFKETT